MEHLSTIEVRVDCLEEEASRVWEEGSQLMAQLLSLGWSPISQAEGSRGSRQGEMMVGKGGGQEGRDKPCTTPWGPDTFLGATGCPDPFPSLDPDLNQTHFGAGL